MYEGRIEENWYIYGLKGEGIVIKTHHPSENVIEYFGKDLKSKYSKNSTMTRDEIHKIEGNGRNPPLVWERS